MATGKTNARYIKILLDNISDSATDITASVSDISWGLDFATTDVTAYSDGVVNFTLGHPSGEVDISGPFNNTATTGGHTVFGAMIDAPYTLASYTLTIQVGIRAAATGGDPEFEGEYVLSAYNISGDGSYTAHLVPALATVPAWGTV